MNAARLGFIGLGNMGGPMAANLAAAGIALSVYDQAGTAERAPEGAHRADSAAEVAAATGTVLLSLPDGDVSRSVAREIAGAPGRTASVVIDFSTIGLDASRDVHALLAEAGIAYIDAPVSGGTRGAKNGTLTVIWGGSADIMAANRAALDAVAGIVFHVGDHPGQGQAMKLLNNYLSAVAMAATSEAIAFGLSQELDFATMLEVINVSTGRNEASADKFPSRILSGTYDAGFHMALMTKDIVLYLESARQTGSPVAVGEPVVALWRQADDAMPGADFTRIFDFVRNPAAR